MDRTLVFGVLGAVVAAWGYAGGAELGKALLRAPAPLPITAAAAVLPGATREAPPSPPAVVAPVPAVVDACASLTPPALPEVSRIGDDPAIPGIDDPHGAMAGFYTRLARHARGEGRDHVRIGVYGDSNHTHDFLSGQLRRRIQAVYGDGGHGFVALARPWRGSYVHMDVLHSDWPGWDPYNVTTDTIFDGRYGHAFISAQSNGAAFTWVSTAPEGAPVGTKVGRFEVSYVRGPFFGSFDAKIDGQTVREVDTHADAFAAGFTTLEVPDGPHKLVIASHASRAVRMLGTVLERDAPGVVVDGLGVGAMNCASIVTGNEAIFSETLKRRRYDLLVVHLGTNLFFTKEIFPCMTKLVKRLRRTLPDTPVLLLSPVDFLDWASPPRSATYILKAREEIAKAAAETGEPFWDFHAAMGGPASMAKYRKLGMTLDSTHLNEQGGAYMGDRLFFALMKGFRGFVQEYPRAGCD